MFLSATTLKLMMDKGLVGQDLLDVYAALEADWRSVQPIADETDPVTKKRARDAERMRVKREHERQSRDVASDNGDIGDEAPPPPSFPPEPPQLPTPTRVNKSTRVKGRSRRCPVEWEASASTVETLSSEGYSPGELERAMTRMRDYEFRDAKSDWDAVFRTWVRRDPPLSAKPTFSPRAPHERPHTPEAKRSAREDNLSRGWDVGMAVARSRAGG